MIVNAASAASTCRFSMPNSSITSRSRPMTAGHVTLGWRVSVPSFVRWCEDDASLRRGNSLDRQAQFTPRRSDRSLLPCQISRSCLPAVTAMSVIAQQPGGSRLAMVSRVLTASPQFAPRKRARHWLSTQSFFSLGWADAGADRGISFAFESFALGMPILRNTRSTIIIVSRR